MKRLILVLGVLVSFGTIGHSQVLIALIFGDKLNSPNLEFGLSAGASLSTITNLEDAKYRPAFNLGLYFDIHLKNNWWLHPEVQVKSSRGAKGLHAYPTGDADLDNVFGESKVERIINGFYVPILINYKFPKGFAVEAGIEPALRTKARDVFTEEYSDVEDLSYTVDIRDNVPRLDFGLDIGGSWRIQKDHGITINARYTEGLVNLNKQNTGNAQRNRAFVLSALIPIGAAKAAEKQEGSKASE